MRNRSNDNKIFIAQAILALLEECPNIKTLDLDFTFLNMELFPLIHNLKLKSLAVKIQDSQQLQCFGTYLTQQETLEKLKVNLLTTRQRYQNHKQMQMKKKLKQITLLVPTNEYSRTHFGGFYQLIMKNNKVLTQLRLHNFSHSNRFIRLLNTTSVRDLSFSGHSNKLDNLFKQKFDKKIQEMTYYHRFIRNIEKLMIYGEQHQTEPKYFDIDFQKWKRLKVFKSTARNNVAHRQDQYLLLRKNLISLFKSQSLEFASLMPIFHQSNDLQPWKVFEILADVICIQTKINIKHLECLYLFHIYLQLGTIK
eukprot:403376997